MDEDIPVIQRLQEGDEGALIELMARHKAGVYRLAYRFTGNATDAADLAEETFVRVYFNARKYKPKAKVKSWIFTIAANLSRDFLRRSKKRRGDVSMHAPLGDHEGAGDLESTLADSDPDPGARAGSTESLRELNAVIAEMPYKLRFPFVFCNLEDHPYSECAEVLGVSVKTVETRIYRARKYLQRVLGGK